MDRSEAKKKDQLPACPVETTLTLIGDKWKVLILRDLMPGIKRFGELRKSVGDVSHRRCSPPSCGTWRKAAWSTGRSMPRCRPGWIIP